MSKLYLVLSLVLAFVALGGCATTSSGQYLSCDLNANAVLSGDYSDVRLNCRANKTIRN